MNHATGIPESNRAQVAVELAKLLADEYVLFTATKNAHWNVTGADFAEKHRLFDEQAAQLVEAIDNVAERIRILGGVAPATLREFAQLTRLKETPAALTHSPVFISELLAGHQTIIAHLRRHINQFANELGDAGTSDFVTSLMQEHEKTAWILSAHSN